MRNSMYFLWVIAFIGIMQACTETEYIDFEKEPQNRILEYRVTNSQQELLGAIDNQKNTITVYIPYYLGIDYLNAEVKLEEGAKLLDGAGNEINLDGGLNPIRVSPDSATYDYTVVAATGEQRTYTLFQKVLPYPHTLDVKYAAMDTSASFFTIPVNFYMEITGNFESTITNSKIILTNKASGEVHEDWIRPVSMTAGNNEYTLRTLISADANAGEYRVRVEHQGRSASLPDLKLVFTRPFSAVSSTANYAPGDTITFRSDPVWSIASGYNGGVFLPVERAYIKIVKDYPGRSSRNEFIVPDEFPDSLLGKEIEMKVVSQTRTELKCIFPDMPAGGYRNNSVLLKEYIREDGRKAYFEQSNFNFYVDWAGSTGWAKEEGNILRVSSILFTVNPRK